MRTAGAAQSGTVCGCSLREVRDTSICDALRTSRHKTCNELLRRLSWWFMRFAMPHFCLAHFCGEPFWTSKQTADEVHSDSQQPKWFNFLCSESFERGVRYITHSDRFKSITSWTTCAQKYKNFRVQRAGRWKRTEVDECQSRGRASSTTTVTWPVQTWSNRRCFCCKALPAEPSIAGYPVTGASGFIREVWKWASAPGPVIACLLGGPRQENKH